jgi:oligosaccharyltransferase complex subunit gamma
MISLMGEYESSNDKNIHSEARGSVPGLRERILTGRRPPTAEQVHGWVARHLPGRPHPPIRRPINWMKWATTLTVILGGGSALVTASPYVIPVVQNRTVWAAVSLVSILLFTSGHMFNHIRKVPYVAGDGRGGVSYFAGSFQSQYGLETQVVAAICEFRPN